jgi:hypothetical protein
MFRNLQKNFFLTDKILKKNFLQKSLLPCEKHIKESFKYYVNTLWREGVRMLFWQNVMFIETFAGFCINKYKKRDFKKSKKWQMFTVSS